MMLRSYFSMVKKTIALAGVLVFSNAWGVSFAYAEESSADFLKRLIPEVVIGDLDSENVEVSARVGNLSFRHFGVVPAYGGSLAYHPTDSVFVELAVLRATAALTSFERLNGGLNLLSDDGRDFLFSGLAFGYNVLKADLHMHSISFKGDVYTLAGGGVTDFADETNYTAQLGTGVRLFWNDWLAIRWQTEALIFDSDVLGVEELTTNILWSFAASVYF